MALASEQLTANFHLQEFVRSATADRKGIDNTPNDAVVERLKDLANVLENVRDILRSRVIVLSGYRCASLNVAVGGVRNSAHLDGYAADFVCPGYGDPRRVFERLAVGLYSRFDQLIYEKSLQGGWIHLSVNPAFRGEIIDLGTGEVRAKRFGRP